MPVTETGYLKYPEKGRLALLFLKLVSDGVRGVIFQNIFDFMQESAGKGSVDYPVVVAQG
jgi:hypothetical protein